LSNAKSWKKRLRSLAREDGRARLLMTAPGVGTIVALTYAAAIDDPSRFRSSKAVGAHFGLTPKKYQSGETDVTGRISKIGDGGVRTSLDGAAILADAHKLTRRSSLDEVRALVRRLAKATLDPLEIGAIRKALIDATGYRAADVDAGIKKPQQRTIARTTRKYG
jgi:transposase